ncbi:MAG: hypothetical protein JW841_04975 [Deltaproteobacteria bacterium]|nr:hypothetical protein [Deltaproteobacteria bacterium]
MAEIHNRRGAISDEAIREQLREKMHKPRATDDDVRQLLRDIAKDKARIAELAKIDVKNLSNEVQKALGRFIARELRGQLPTPLAQALTQALVGAPVIQTLVNRLANAYGGEALKTLPQATSPEGARTQASDGTAPQQALRWVQFVQHATHVPGGGLQSRAGFAAPKGEMALLAEMLGQRQVNINAAGFRAPKLVERELAQLSPGQRTMLMKMTFGDKLANQLMQLGIQDPMGLVRAGALPQNRADLAAELGIDRGKLLALVMRTELLKIGPGRNGEMGIKPHLLGPLYKSGIAMLGTMSAVRSLRGSESSIIYKILHQAAAGFANAMQGRAIPAKRDLLHWARTAARRPSDILLADADDLKEGHLSRDDAQELIMAWYLENLFWDAFNNREHIRKALERQRREEEQQAITRREADDEENRRRQQDDQRDREDEERQREDDPFADFDYDHERDDKLMCFWITDFNTTPGVLNSMRRMYVCIDPDTGAIIPQQVEADILPTYHQ